MKHWNGTWARPAIVGALLGFLALATAALVARAQSRATASGDLSVYIVRHAEKLSQGKDPKLSAQGQARSAQLAHVLSQISLDAVYVTKYQRSRQTGQTVAARLGTTLHTYAASKASELAESLRKSGSSGAATRNILVVGHSNTVDDLVKAFGGPTLPELLETQYDQLLVVHRIGSAVFTQPLRFGVPTP